MYFNLPKRTHLYRFRKGIAVSQLILPGHEDGFNDDREAMHYLNDTLRRGVVIDDIKSVSPADTYLPTGKDS